MFLFFLWRNLISTSFNYTVKYLVQLEKKTHYPSFFDESTNFIPQKNLSEISQIAGPFTVYIGDAKEALELSLYQELTGSKKYMLYAKPSMGTTTHDPNYYNSLTLVVYLYNC